MEYGISLAKLMLEIAVLRSNDVSSNAAHQMRHDTQKHAIYICHHSNILDAQQHDGTYSLALAVRPGREGGRARRGVLILRAVNLDART